MLTTLSAATVLENFHSHLLAWLQISDDSLKASCLNQLSRLGKEVPSELSQCEKLVEAIVDQVGQDSLNIGPVAASVLTQIGQDPNGLQILFSEEIIKKIILVMQKNDVTRFRIYQIAIDLSKSSQAALEASASSGLLQQLINEAQSNDILVQLNAIELVSDLAQSPHGLLFLDQHGIVSQLEQMMVGLTDNPMMGILLPG
ncbi:26S proteasome non-ATPase regulatory subunit 5 [Bulinus truncatus]|nr:26S proteasome non-ATPase regulatory subunit 5 [Bulinus truncatus]